MKISKQKLEQIIREEINYTLLEEGVQIDEASFKQKAAAFLASIATMIPSIAGAEPVAVKMRDRATGEEDVVMMDDHGNYDKFKQALIDVNKKANRPYEIIGIQSKSTSAKTPEKAPKVAKVSAEETVTVTVPFKKMGDLDLAKQSALQQAKVQALRQATGATSGTVEGGARVIDYKIKGDTLTATVTVTP